MTATPLVETTLAPPRFTVAGARALVANRWGGGLAGELTPLPSERDQNFRVTAPNGACFVLKISAAAEDARVLDCQQEVVKRLAAAVPGYDFPVSVTDRGGAAVVGSAGPDGGSHLVRLLRYVNGVPLAAVPRHSPALLEEAGAFLGAMTQALAGFDHPGAHRDLRWDLRVARRVIDQCEGAVTAPERRRNLAAILAVVDREVAPLLPHLRTSVVHNDANDNNILVSPADPGDPWPERRVAGIVDFGDVVHSFTVAEVAVAAAYTMLHTRDPLAAAAHVVRGFHGHFPLSEPEIAALFPLTCLRLCLSAVLAAHQRKQQPDNHYLSVSEPPVWELLARLEGVHPNLAHYRFREACQLPPCPATARVVQALTDRATTIGAVLDPDPRDTARAALDFSVGSTEWSTIQGEGAEDAAAWEAAVDERLGRAGATLGVGRYDEARRWYTTPQFRVSTDSGDEWRTIHIGVDLCAKAGTPVYAPLDATVATVTDNSGSLDYGPTLILRHSLDDQRGERVAFHTLYGHLEREVLGRLKPGQTVRRGERIGFIGSRAVNGGWAPHLHLQILVDPLDASEKGDFPGVARPSERALWLALSPDPNLILRLPEGCRATTAPSGDQILEERRRRIGPSLSLAYRAPLTIVRGWRQHLYDDVGRAYLDVVNNVAHVGHCHPRVVAALHAQAAVLNTNTRYLHPNLVHYARRLTARLPEPLRVCYFVCSGSEANELAIRMARAFTGQRDVVVLDHAYHGSTSALVEMSPYKFDGPGGAGPGASVHKVPLPDPYRGFQRAGGTDAASYYAERAREVIAEIGQGRRLGAFFSEAIVSGAGHVEPPADFVRDVYRQVRAAGGVCVADEVQTGFGRIGSHFWAFEVHGVVPDIVTMGKPIGNGHPLGAVVTTPEIAAAFDNGMEYFNTFGGNPASCAVGLAVLDVIEDEGLQEHARVVGDRLAAGLRGLMARHQLVGDVRGRGLFQAIELVRDRDTLDPAPRHASYIVERMKERGVLLSTEGPLHNVIKMKPPLVFDESDADRVVSGLEAVLEECQDD